MRLTPSILSVLFLIFLLCAPMITKAASDNIKTQEHATPLDYEIYSTIIRSIYPKDDITLTVIDETSFHSNENVGRDRNTLSRTGETMYSELNKLNKSPVQFVANLFRVQVPIRTMTYDELYYLQDNEGYPFMVFSRIVYNEKTTKALLYVEDMKWKRIGEGSLYVLEKKEHGWIIIDKLDIVTF